VRKSETLRGHGVFRTVTANGKRIDGKIIRSYSVISASPSPSFAIGMSVSGRRLNAVQRNRIRRRMREAFARERSRLAGTVEASGVSLATVFSFRPRNGEALKTAAFSDVHADVSSIIDKIISRIRQQWAQQ